MKKETVWVIVAILVVLSAIVLKISSPKNYWSCERGEWIKVGKPKEPKPQIDCFDQYSIAAEIEILSGLLEPNLNIERETDNEAQDLELFREIDVDTPLDSSAEEGVPRLVQLISPQAGEAISSPYQMIGFARGPWYFEANFPVIVKSDDGTILLETYAEAQDDWMTESLVPFRANLVFNSYDYSKGEIIIKRANPSGFPEYDAQISYPIIFLQEDYEN